MPLHAPQTATNVSIQMLLQNCNQTQ